MESSAFLGGSSPTGVKEVLLHYPLPIIHRRLFVSSDNGHRSIVGRFLLLVRRRAISNPFEKALLFRPFVACCPRCCLLHRSVCVCPGHTLRGGKRNTTQPARSLARQSPIPFTLSLTPPSASSSVLRTHFIVPAMTLDLRIDPRIIPPQNCFLEVIMGSRLAVCGIL